MMIESERHKQRVTEIVTRWCRNTKVEPYLRVYDIPGLVSSIMDEFYHVQLCCGHLVNSIDEGVDLEMDNDDGGVSCGCYCKDCAEEYIKEGAREV